MLDNEKLFSECLNALEPFAEDIYNKNVFVITPNPSEQNELMRANAEITENISAYKVAFQHSDRELCNTIVERITALLRETESINYSEFVNFWKVYDASYSVFKKLSDVKRRQEFVRELIEKFLQERHGVYLAHGYSASTLQVLSDSFAHKRSGEIGIHKLTLLLDGAGFFHYGSDETASFADSERSFLVPDKILADLRTFRETLKRKSASFRWSVERQNKAPDCCLVLNGKIFIVEHKHVKEPGGGQDKQVVELIDFIKQSDKGVSYVAFLDGAYFNFFAQQKTSPRIQEQLNQIRRSLATFKNNYFVNTFGFTKLLNEK